MSNTYQLSRNPFKIVWAGKKKRYVFAYVMKTLLNMSCHQPYLSSLCSFSVQLGV